MTADGLKFREIHDRFYEQIHRYLERMVGKNDAEDLTQEVFVKIDKGMEGFKGRASVSTWVYRIATNAAVDRIRSRSHKEDRRTTQLYNSENDERTEDVCVDKKSLSADREAIRNEMNDCIREYVDRLPTDYRTVIILSEIKELKNREIADILGIGLDAVKIRLHRARVRLKTEFEEGCEFYHDEEGNLACDRKKNENKCE